MKIRIFGEPWDAPVCDDAIAENRVVEAPVGQPCLWCDEPIQAGENGVLMAALNVAGWSLAPMHKECNLRSIAGSLGHITHRCPCYGGKMHDPDGLTKRQAALAVWDWVMATVEDTDLSVHDFSVDHYS